MDGADVFTGVSTSSKRYLWRRHLGFKMAAPEMTSTRTWGTFFDPYWGGGAKWRPFRFRWPSWMTSFAEPEMTSSKMAAGSGRAAILHLPLNGDRKKYPILLRLHKPSRSRWFETLSHSLWRHCNDNSWAILYISHTDMTVWNTIKCILI